MILMVITATAGVAAALVVLGRLSAGPVSCHAEPLLGRQCAARVTHTLPSRTGW